VACGTPTQVQAVLDSGLVPLAIRCMSDPELVVAREAVWVVANIAAAGTSDQLRAAVEHFDCVPALCAVLRTRNVKICSVALETAEAILVLGETLSAREVNPYAAHFEDHGLLDILFDLKESPSDNVQLRATSLLEVYWGDIDL
jgi:hypothetical protein